MGERPDPLDRFRRILSRSRSSYAEQAKSVILDAGANFDHPDTTTRLIEIANRVTVEAVETCLGDIGRISGHSARRRARLLESLVVAAAAHAHELADQLDSDLPLVIPDLHDRLSAELNNVIDEVIQDYRVGWTAPIRATFKERHPLLYDVILVICSAAAGGLVTLLLT